MKVTGVIAEYNPFHNGHEYHLQQARKITGAEYLVAVMSGDFVQRGEPALFDKYIRTKMALLGGADLVLELPVLFSVASAGDFASGSVSLLDQLGVVDCLCFGSESGDTAQFLQAAKALAEESPAFSAALKENQQKGLSYPRARMEALRTAGPTILGLSDDFFLSPNNILGLEYTVALTRRHSAIRPAALLRCGAPYGQKEWEAASSSCPCGFPSALSLRALIGSDPAYDENPRILAQIKKAVPACHHALWETLLHERRALFASDFTKELRYRLLTEERADFIRYADVNRALSDKIKNGRMGFCDWQDLCHLLKSKELTYSRISRALCHILLSVTADEMGAAREQNGTPYARILGFKRSARPLLSAIRKHSAIPLLSKLADAPGVLNPPALAMLRKDLLAASVYESVLAAKQGRAMQNEISRGLVILEQ